MGDLSRRLQLLASVAVVLGASLGPAHADRLVTEEGHVIETRGPWKVDGALVVFERSDGSLSSMRLSMVDLDASRKATEEGRKEAERKEEKEAPSETEEAAREPVLRLTDQDLPPVGRSARSAEEGRSSEDSTAAAARGERGVPEEDEAASPGLEIVEWEEDDRFDKEGVIFVGAVRNDSDHTAVGIRVTGVVFDEEGNEAGSTSAILSATSLRPGERADFRAELPGVFSYSEIEFQVEGDLLVTESGGQGEESTGGAEDEARPEG